MPEQEGIDVSLLEALSFNRSSPAEVIVEAVVTLTYCVAMLERVTLRN